MHFFLLFSSFFALVVTSYLACKYLVYFSHKHSILDEKNLRSSHVHPTPRIGGLSFTSLIFLMLIVFFYLGELSISSHYYLALIVPPFLVSIISIIDDLRNGISRVLRLSVHLLASAFALLLLVSVPKDLLQLIVFLISVISIAWFINLFNFMDGIDGIAASESIFVISTSAGFSFFAEKSDWATIQLIMVAPIVGFTIINWQPAKIFMGDVGSTFLGILLPIVLIISIQQDVMTIWSAIILTSSFLVDASWTLATRFLTGQKWHQPHRSHLYQILSRELGSHSKVCLFNLAFNICWILPLSIAALVYSNLGQLFTLCALLPITLLCIMRKAGKPEASRH